MFSGGRRKAVHDAIHLIAEDNVTNVALLQNACSAMFNMESVQAMRQGANTALGVGCRAEHPLKPNSTSTLPKFHITSTTHPHQTPHPRLSIVILNLMALIKA